MISEQERTLRELAKAAKRRDKAAKARSAAIQDVRTYVEAAGFAGVPVTEIAAAAGLSRQAVYDVLGPRPAS